MVLFAFLFFSHGFSSPAQAHSHVAVTQKADTQKADTQNCDGSARPGISGDVRTRNRQDDPPSSVNETSRGTPVATTPSVAAARPANGAVSAPYGMRRQRSGALLAVLQVFRC
jgi:hypothetical protein